MRTTVKMITAMLLATICVAPTIETAYAASEVPPSSDPIITVNPTAPGTKVSGILTIAYDNLTFDPNVCADFGNLKAELIVVLRLARGNSAATFSGASAAPVCFGDIPPQQALVEQIIIQDVLPSFDLGNTFEVRSVKNILLNANSQPPAVSMDVELAIR